MNTINTNSLELELPHQFQNITILYYGT